MTVRDFYILVDVGADWPEIVGPFSDRMAAEYACDKVLTSDPRVRQVEIQIGYKRAYRLIEDMDKDPLWTT